jgi:hypothetical protein
MANSNGGNNRRNRLEVPGARSLMDQLKMEVATELGIPNYDTIDKGDIPARVHGKIGGNMVRKLIEYAETHMVMDGQNAMNEIAAMDGPNKRDIETVARYQSQIQTAGQGNSNPSGNQEAVQ